MTFSKLGTDNDTGQIVELSQSSRRQGLYIIGANGTGKTGLIEHLILQDIEQGLGVGLLDPHGDLVNAILTKMTKREADVILLDIQDEDHPFGLNLFECPNPQSPTAVQKIVDLVMHIFEKLYDVSRQTPRMAQFLRNCTHTLVANPGYTMADIPLLLQDEQCRKKLVANVTDPQVQLFWKTYNALRPSEQFDRAESTINKMDELLQPLPRNIVGQAQTTVNIQQVMDERKILLVKLSAQLDQVTSLVGTLFIALFLNAAYSRANIPVNKRKQFNLYADEFQRFATEDFATLLTEARKFGIATTIAHQARYQPGMTDGIRAVSLQAANHIVFRVTSPDADELAGGFDTTPPPPQPEEKTRRSIQTPVMEPIQFMLHKGVHPHPEVRNFINVYGQELVQGVKNEEEAARNYQHALNTYYRDVGRGYLFAGIEPSPPTQYYHLTLESLNQLFYQAMVVGKQGGNTDTIPITSEFIGYFIEALTTVPDEVKQFHRLQQQYIDYALQQQIHVGDWNTREWEVQKRLAQLALPQFSPQQNELQLAQARYTKAVVNLRLALRRAFVAQVQEITRRCVIVRRGSWYYRPKFSLEYSLPDEIRYELDIEYESMDRDFQKLHLNNLGDYVLSQRFRSFDEAIAFHVQALRFLWFRVEPTLRDKNWWQHKRGAVDCLNRDKKRNHIHSLETLEMWMLKPGIEHEWYTTAMVDNMVESTLQAVIDLWTGGMSRPQNAENLTAFLPTSLGGEDYRELTFLSQQALYERFEEQGVASQEAYDAQHELTKLQGEIAGEVHQEKASLQSELRILTELLKHKQLYDKFIIDFTNQLRIVMRVLGVERIETESGQQEIVMGHGIQLSSAEMLARIVNQLSGLPNYTARVKLGENVPQNPGKKCLNCGKQCNPGALYCGSCGTKLPALNEYTLTTLKPLGGIGKAVLQQRLKTIETNNMQKGYVRDRTKVEAEISKRQAGCSGVSAPAQPQQPILQTPRHARQVRVQGKCQNCGASNSPGAKFCNQCGMKS